MTLAETAVVALLRRAALETVQAYPASPATTAQLAATLDELCAALRGTPNEAMAIAARSALPASRGAVSDDGLAQVADALDEIERRLSGEAMPGVAPEGDVDLRWSSGAPALAAVASINAGRDPETIELFGDFLAEGEEGLARVDEILLGAEKGGIEDEHVNELFRVFHTIKGVSGFLDAADVTRLAHATETLLDGARTHRIALTGPVLDVVFESSSTMRRLLERVRESVEQDLVVEADVALDAVLERIALADGGTLGEVSLHGLADAGGAGAVPPVGPVSEPPAPSADDGKEGVRPEAQPTEVRSPPPDSSSAVTTAGRVEATSERATSARLRETVKVDLERIDSVVEMIGELIIVESMVVNAPEVVALPSLKLRNYLGQLTKISRDLQSVAMRMRMIPVRGVFQKMARLTRDLSRKTGKVVELVQSGEGTEMDRSMVERIEIRSFT